MTRRCIENFKIAAMSARKSFVRVLLMSRGGRYATSQMVLISGIGSNPGVVGRCDPMLLEPGGAGWSAAFIRTLRSAGAHHPWQSDDFSCGQRRDPRDQGISDAG